MKKKIKISALSAVSLVILFYLCVQMNPRSVELLSLNENDLTSYFEKYHLGNSSAVQEGIRQNILAVYPNSDSFKIKTERDQALISNPYKLKDKNTLNRIRHHLHALFLFFPEEMTIKNRPESFKRLPFAVQKILINTGIWAPLCGDISNITADILKRSSDSIVYAGTVPIPSLKHTITGLIYIEQTDKYVLGVDAQNGFMGPFHSDTHLPLTVTELLQRITDKNFQDLELQFLDSIALRSKKTFIPVEYATNILPDGKPEIFKSSFLNIYPAYRKTYPTHYYLWFHKKMVNEDAIKKDITIQLYNNLSKVQQDRSHI